MPEITLEAIANLLHHELDVQLAPIKSELLAIRQTVDGHTTTIDTIVKNTANWQVEMTVMRDKMERYEKAIKILAEKLNVDVESILH